jgi:hypothetical protein
MKRISQILVLAIFVLLVTGCNSSKNAANKVNHTALTGKWTVSDIKIDVPAGYKVTDVFDEAPYQNFQGSTWDLIRNGKGSFTLTNGTKEDIFWSIIGKGDQAQFQFKKLNGAKAKNVGEGYRLQLQNVSNNSFIAKSPVDIGNGNTGYIIYTFTK